MSDQPRCETRAHARAREAAEVAPEVVAVVAVPGDYRTPRVRVDVALGSVVVAFSAAGLKRQMVEVRAPMSVDGRSAVVVPPDLQKAINAAVFEAVKADRVAWSHLAKRRG